MGAPDLRADRSAAIVLAGRDGLRAVPNLISHAGVSGRCNDIFVQYQDPEAPASISNHQTDSNSMPKLLKIAKTKDLPPGEAAAFTVEGQKIALFNVEGTYYAIGDTCTHRGGPLSEGEVQGTKVTCPWHGADFDIKTGAVLGPPAQNSVPSYKVMVDGDDIKVEV